jgi:hypothetical protein
MVCSFARGGMNLYNGIVAQNRKSDKRERGDRGFNGIFRDKEGEKRYNKGKEIGWAQHRPGRREM